MKQNETHAYHLGYLPNRREFARTSVTFIAELQPDEGPLLVGSVDELSIKGLHFVSEQRVPVGTQCQVTLLPGGLTEVPASDADAVPVKITATGQVVRLTQDGFGLEFTEIVGQESFDYLCYFLWNLAEDKDRIEQEIKSSSWAHISSRSQAASAGSPPSGADTRIKRRPGRHLSLSK